MTTGAVRHLHVGPEFHAEQHIHPEPTSFIRKYVFSTDHKVIAKQFLWPACSSSPSAAPWRC